MKMINFVETKSGYQEKLKLLRTLNEINVKLTKYKADKINDKIDQISIFKCPKKQKNHDTNNERESRHHRNNKYLRI